MMRVSQAFFNPQAADTCRRIGAKRSRETTYWAPESLNWAEVSSAVWRGFNWVRMAPARSAP